MFWIFGGSLQFGHGGVPSYDGSSFAAYEDVIIVTSNYRTNLFGFPGSPELPITERNLGFIDQRFALDWVQRNIHAFGGDPCKVTIFGESAGGYSIDAHLTSYDKDSAPPFRAAILESGQYTYRSSANANSTTAWYNLTSTLGCPGSYANNLTCVRAANATTLQTIVNENTLVNAPVVDNITFVNDPAQRRLSGNIARIPVLGGTNAQEGRLFVVNQTDLNSFLNKTFGDKFSDLIPAIKAAYPLVDNSNASQYDTISEIYGELTFLCPQAYWANATAAIGIPTWRYFFNASFANQQVYQNLGAYHASEVMLVFRTFPQPNATTQQDALGRTMQSMWAQFAKNPYAGPGWNAVGSGREGEVLVGAYDETNGGVLRMGNKTEVTGDWSLGVFGDVGHVRGSGVTVLPQRDFDARCELFRPIFESVGGKDSTPPWPQ
ncbi:alpha/beta-hydrolase [Phaeosphaeriaceae sp. SRC1lsM3a]|nr:alpha/beta-hydrolase [Stagonospora sp. SRC1lsM3a]